MAKQMRNARRKQKQKQKQKLSDTMSLGSNQRRSRGTSTSNQHKVHDLGTWLAMRRFAIAVISVIVILMLGILDWRIRKEDPSDPQFDRIPDDDYAEPQSRRALDDYVAPNPVETCNQTHRPNILIFLTDDQGFGDRQKYNGHVLEMPRLEQFASEGMDFQSGHSASGVCSPSRFAMMTGEMWFRHHANRNAIGSNAHPYIMDAKDTLPRMLKRVGYRAYMSGKWHIGMEINTDRLTDEIYGGPIDGGFDKFFGIPASMDYGNLGYIGNKTFISPPTQWSDRWDDLVWSCRQNVSTCHTWSMRTCTRAIRGKCEEGGYRYEKDGHWNLAIAPDFDPQMALKNITDHAQVYIDHHMQEFGTGTPFFLHVPVTAPHKPHEPHPDFLGTNKVKFGRYADMLEEVDYRFGQILDKLKEWEIENETLVIYSSDNGPEGKSMFERSGGLLSAWKYRAGKRSLFEGGHRVPFLMRWPEVIPRATLNMHPVSQIDLFKTLAEITGANYSSDASSDGFSFWNAVCDHEGANLADVREKQPLISEVPEKVSKGSTGVQVSCGEMKAFVAHNRWWMFNTTADPFETNDIKDHDPATFAELQELIDEIVTNGFSNKTNICT